jgi:hypothetical protein
MSKIISNGLAKRDFLCMDSLDITIHYVTDFVHTVMRSPFFREIAKEDQCSGT